MKDGEAVDWKDRVCYMSVKEEHNRGAVFMLDKVESKLSRTITKEYIEWWVQGSFAADAFVSKNWIDILCNGAILDCSLPAPYVILAASGLRYLKDETKIVENWSMFKHYVPSDAAIIMAHMLSQNDRRYWIASFRANNYNHTFFQRYWRKEEFTKAVNHNLSSMSSLPPMSKDTNYVPLISIFSPDYKGQSLYNLRDGNLSYPPTTSKITLRDSFGGESDTVDVYDVRDIEEWLKETYSLNYLKEREK